MRSLRTTESQRAHIRQWEPDQRPSEINDDDGYQCTCSSASVVIASRTACTAGGLRAFDRKDSISPRSSSLICGRSSCGGGVINGDERSPTQRSSGAIRGHQRSSEVIRGHQRSSEVIRGHQRSSEVITCRQSSCNGTRSISGGWKGAIASERAFVYLPGEMVWAPSWARACEPSCTSRNHTPSEWSSDSIRRNQARSGEGSSQSGEGSSQSDEGSSYSDVITCRTPRPPAHGPHVRAVAVGSPLRSNSRSAGGAD